MTASMLLDMAHGWLGIEMGKGIDWTSVLWDLPSFDERILGRDNMVWRRAESTKTISN